MTKQFRFEQVLWNRSAVDTYEFLVFPWTVEMNGLRDEFFSSPCFALNENGAAQTGDRIYKFKDPFHRTSRADDIVKAVFFVELLPQIVVFEAQVAFSNALSNHDRQFDQFEGLGQVVIRPLFHGSDGGLD